MIPPRPAKALSAAPPLPPADADHFDFGDLDRWLDLTDQAIRRVERVLGQYTSSPAGRPLPLGSDHDRSG